MPVRFEDLPILNILQKTKTLKKRQKKCLCLCLLLATSLQLIPNYLYKSYVSHLCHEKFSIFMNEPLRAPIAYICHVKNSLYLHSRNSERRSTFFHNLGNSYNISQAAWKSSRLMLWNHYNICVYLHRSHSLNAHLLIYSRHFFVVVEALIIWFGAFEILSRHKNPFHETFNNLYACETW